MAASMGSILLGAGTKGKRSSLPNSRVMLHQISAGMRGEIQSMRISLQEAEKYNDKLFKMLGEYCGKDPEQVKLDADRDKWMDADEALDYGIIDFIITKKR
jgi:ATP-dependent Clp protease protease subunit